MGTNVKELQDHHEFADGYAIVDFIGDHCAPCVAFAPTFARLADEFSGRIQFCKADVDSSPELADRFNIRSLPTIVILKDGKEVSRIFGLTSAVALKKKIESVLSSSIGS